MARVCNQAAPNRDAHHTRRLRAALGLDSGLAAWAREPEDVIMTDEVRQICRRWLLLSAIGASIGFLLAYGLGPSKSVFGFVVFALPIAAVALAQIVALYRYQPISDMALLWVLLTPLFVLVAYILGFAAFSGYRHVPSYREYATVVGMVTTPFLLVLGWIQGAIVKTWLGRAPFWALITAVGNVVALASVVLLAWLFEVSGLMDLLDKDRVMAGAFAPLMFVLSAFQMISLKNVALHTEPFRRLR
jgi:hypothetical protein